MSVPNTLRPEPRDGYSSLYRLYSADGALLYIGSGPDPAPEWDRHAKDYGWWPQVADAFVQWLPLDQIEQACAAAQGAERARHKRDTRRALPGMASFPEAARRLVAEGIVADMAASKLRRISRTDPDWPLHEEDYVPLAHGISIPWEPVAEYFRRKREPEGPPVRTALYRYFDQADRLLYVGVAADMERRHYQHSINSDWWGRAATRSVEWHDSRDLALAAEIDAIQAERPMENFVYRARRPVDITATLPGALTRYEIGLRYDLSVGAVRELTFKPGFPVPMPPLPNDPVGRPCARYVHDEVDAYFSPRTGETRREPPMANREPVRQPSRRPAV